MCQGCDYSSAVSWRVSSAKNIRWAKLSMLTSDRPARSDLPLHRYLSMRGHYTAAFSRWDLVWEWRARARDRNRVSRKCQARAKNTLRFAASAWAIVRSVISLNSRSSQRAGIMARYLRTGRATTGQNITAMSEPIRPVFKTTAIDHSAIPPHRNPLRDSWKSAFPPGLP